MTTPVGAPPAYTAVEVLDRTNFIGLGQFEMPYAAMDINDLGEMLVASTSTVQAARILLAQ